MHKKKNKAKVQKSKIKAEGVHGKAHGPGMGVLAQKSTTWAGHPMSWKASMQQSL